MYENTEDVEMAEVTDNLNDRLNYEEANMGGKRTSIIHKGYASRYLFEIEKFVQAIEKRWKGGFIDEVKRYSGIKTIRELYLGKMFYRFLNEWLERYSDIYRYSARVEVFYDVCKELGLIGQQPFVFGEPGDVARADGARYMDAFNILIEKIRVRCQTREFKERERLRAANAEKNKRNVLALEEAIFSEEAGRSRWLVLSLTLRYAPRFRRWITPEVIQQHRNSFFKARCYNTLMSGIKTYAWAIEQGEETGLHLHVILFYSGEHNHDEHIAKMIGEYWVNVVTEGKGEYWNSNQKKLKEGYKKKRGVGVGQINWNDAGKRKALRQNLVYLAKAEQYLMIKGAENMHTFGMGTVPEKVTAGRPRSVKPKFADNPACSTSANPLESSSMDATSTDKDDAD